MSPLEIVFTHKIPGDLDTCTKCGQAENVHVNGDCLFDSTKFTLTAVQRCFRELLAGGGVLALRTKEYELIYTVQGARTEEYLNVFFGSVTATKLTQIKEHHVNASTSA